MRLHSHSCRDSSPTCLNATVTDRHIHLRQKSSITHKNTASLSLRQTDRQADKRRASGGRIADNDRSGGDSTVERLHLSPNNRARAQVQPALKRATLQQCKKENWRWFNICTTHTRQPVKSVCRCKMTDWIGGIISVVCSRETLHFFSILLPNDWEANVETKTCI